MVTFPEFIAEGPLLQPYLGVADIGLHFDLTTGRSLGALMRDAYLRRVDAHEIAGELERQIAIFLRVMGRMPGYIDGHRHVHLLPGVREIVVRVAKPIGAYVRSACEPIGRGLVRRPSPVEAAYLSWSSGPLQRLADERRVVTNHGFRGARTFKEPESYRALFRRMIEGASAGCLIMCHPGYADDILSQRDGILEPREDELHYLASDDFPRDLAEAGLQLSRLGPARGRT
jgi:predicted glycoside hydrolase/deacetylase ChbG (UPF0249 family)